MSSSKTDGLHELLGKAERRLTLTRIALELEFVAADPGLVLRDDTTRPGCTDGCEDAWCGLQGRVEDTEGGVRAEGDCEYELLNGCRNSLWSCKRKGELIARIAAVINGGEESVALTIEEGHDLEQEQFCFDILWILPESGTKHEFCDPLISVLPEQAHKLLLFQEFAEASDYVVWECDESHC